MLIAISILSSTCRDQYWDETVLSTFSKYWDFLNNWKLLCWFYLDVLYWCTYRDFLRPFETSQHQLDQYWDATIISTFWKRWDFLNCFDCRVDSILTCLFNQNLLRLLILFGWESQQKTCWLTVLRVSVEDEKSWRKSLGFCLDTVLSCQIILSWQSIPNLKMFGWESQPKCVETYWPIILRVTVETKKLRKLRRESISFCHNIVLSCQILSWLSIPNLNMFGKESQPKHGNKK